MKNRVLFIIDDFEPSLLNPHLAAIIADILLKTGFETAFIFHRKESRKLLPAKSQLFFIGLSSLPNVFRNNYLLYDSDLSGKPLFWEYKDLNHRLPENGYSTSRTILKRFNKVLKIAQRWKPDIIFGAGHILAFPLGKQLNIPVLQIGGYLNFSKMKSKHGRLVNPEIQPDAVIESLFSALFAAIQRPLVRTYLELFSGDGYLIPGIPELEPVHAKFPRVYLGYQLDIPWDERLLTIDKKNRQRKIFINLGYTKKPINFQTYFDFFLETFKNTKFQFIVADPSGYLNEKIKQMGVSNFSTFKWINSPQVFPFLDAAIHGGDTKNILDTLYGGIPSLIIPFNSEMESIGRRVEQISAGKMLKLAEGPYRPITIQFPFGNLNVSCGFDITVKPGKLQSEMDELLHNKIYREKSAYYFQKLKEQFQPEGIIKFVKGFI